MSAFLDDDEPTIAPHLVARLRPIRLLCLDVDGVLSDGHLYFSGGEGDARFCQRFSVRASPPGPRRPSRPSSSPRQSPARRSSAPPRPPP